jgi:hypothetical protein
VGSTDFYSCEFISFGIRAQFPIRSDSIFFFSCIFDPSSHCSRVTKKKKKKGCRKFIVLSRAAVSLILLGFLSSLLGLC